MSMNSDGFGNRLDSLPRSFCSMISFLVIRRINTEINPVLGAKGLESLRNELGTSISLNAINVTVTKMSWISRTVLVFLKREVALQGISDSCGGQF